MNETMEAYQVRKTNKCAKGTLKRLKEKINEFLRHFQVFVIGLDSQSLEIIRNGTPKEKRRLYSELKKKMFGL